MSAHMYYIGFGPTDHEWGEGGLVLSSRGSRQEM
jgi:hypothetical protein